MTNYFYFDHTNTKQGPVGEEQLKQLIAQGTIEPQTSMETDTGQQITAGEIPGLFPSASPLPFQPADGSPSQDNVKDAKAKNTAGGMLSALLMTLSGMDNTTKIVIGASATVVLVGLIWLVSGFFGGGNDWRSILRNAKSGDWVEYETIVSTPMGEISRATQRYEVLSNNRRMVRLRVTTTIPPMFPWASTQTDVTEFEIDLSKSDEQIFLDMIAQTITQGARAGGASVPFDVGSFLNEVVDVEVNKGKRTRETLSVAGETFRCTVTPYTISISVDSITLTVRDIKEWFSRRVPVFGMVQAEFRVSVPVPTMGTQSFTVTSRLTSFHK